MKSVWIINGYMTADPAKASKSWEVLAASFMDVVAKFPAKYPGVTITSVMFRGEFEELL